MKWRTGRWNIKQDYLEVDCFLKPPDPTTAAQHVTTAELNIPNYHINVRTNSDNKIPWDLDYFAKIEGMAE